MRRTTGKTTTRTTTAGTVTAGRIRGSLPVSTLLTGLLGLVPGSLHGQFVWPERGGNLQELPADFSGERIRAVMTGFTRALGVRCSYCHAGEEGAPLGTFDFVSDDPPNKERARDMLRLLGSVNGQLGVMDLRDDVERVNMWCHTCHSGRPRPWTLDEAVRDAYGEDDGEAALARFASLREPHWGGPGYDFRPPSVHGVASGFLELGDTATALAFLRRNVEDFPDYVEGWEALGNVAAAQGRRWEAARHYERALERAPEHPRIRAARERVRGGGARPTPR